MHASHAVVSASWFSIVTAFLTRRVAVAVGYFLGVPRISEAPGCGSGNSSASSGAAESSRGVRDRCGVAQIGRALEALAATICEFFALCGLYGASLDVGAPLDTRRPHEANVGRCRTSLLRLRGVPGCGITVTALATLVALEAVDGSKDAEDEDGCAADLEKQRATQHLS